ncbi:MAG: RES family NAD+ phosphorylase [Acidobacteriota bacterium]
MTVAPTLTTLVDCRQTFYRITSPRFHTPRKADHFKVVNGQGAIRSLRGSRYNHPGASTIYLTEDMETCFAERIFYLHRQIVRGLDASHISSILPPFSHHLILWEIKFAKSIGNVVDLRKDFSLFSIFPSMMTNPSQDYEHLKQKRAEIQHRGYEGLIAPSSRSTKPGSLVVLFNDQTKNIRSIDPFELKVRLINMDGKPFANHTTELLDFDAAEVRLTGHGTGAYDNWTKIQFNH